MKELLAASYQTHGPSQAGVKGSSSSTSPRQQRRRHQQDRGEEAEHLQQAAVAASGREHLTRRKSVALGQLVRLKRATNSSKLSDIKQEEQQDSEGTLETQQSAEELQQQRQSDEAISNFTSPLTSGLNLSLHNQAASRATESISSANSRINSSDGTELNYSSQDHHHNHHSQPHLSGSSLPAHTESIQLSNNSSVTHQARAQRQANESAPLIHTDHLNTTTRLLYIYPVGSSPSSSSSSSSLTDRVKQSNNSGDSRKRIAVASFVARTTEKQRLQQQLAGRITNNNHRQQQQQQAMAAAESNFAGPACIRAADEQQDQSQNQQLMSELVARLSVLELEVTNSRATLTWSLNLVQASLGDSGLGGDDTNNNNNNGSWLDRPQQQQQQQQENAPTKLLLRKRRDTIEVTPTLTRASSDEHTRRDERKKKARQRAGSYADDQEGRLEGRGDDDGVGEFEMKDDSRDHERPDARIEGDEEEAAAVAEAEEREKQEIRRKRIKANQRRRAKSIATKTSTTTTTTTTTTTGRPSKPIESKSDDEAALDEDSDQLVVANKNANNRTRDESLAGRDEHGDPADQGDILRNHQEPARVLMHINQGGVKPLPVASGPTRRPPNRMHNLGHTQTTTTSNNNGNSNKTQLAAETPGPIARLDLITRTTTTTSTSTTSTTIRPVRTTDSTSLNATALSSTDLRAAAAPPAMTTSTRLPTSGPRSQVSLTNETGAATRARWFNQSRLVQASGGGASGPADHEPPMVRVAVVPINRIQSSTAPPPPSKSSTTSPAGGLDSDDHAPNESQLRNTTLVSSRPQPTTRKPPSRPKGKSLKMDFERVGTTSGLANATTPVSPAFDKHETSESMTKSVQLTTTTTSSSPAPDVGQQAAAVATTQQQQQQSVSPSTPTTTTSTASSTDTTTSLTSTTTTTTTTTARPMIIVTKSQLITSENSQPRLVLAPSPSSLPSSGNSDGQSIATAANESTANDEPYRVATTAVDNPSLARQEQQQLDTSTRSPQVVAIVQPSSPPLVAVPRESKWLVRLRKFASNEVDIVKVLVSNLDELRGPVTRSISFKHLEPSSAYEICVESASPNQLISDKLQILNANHYLKCQDVSDVELSESHNNSTEPPTMASNMPGSASSELTSPASETLPVAQFNSIKRMDLRLEQDEQLREPPKPVGPPSGEEFTPASSLISNTGNSKLRMKSLCREFYTLPQGSNQTLQFSATNQLDPQPVDGLKLPTNDHQSKSRNLQALSDNNLNETNESGENSPTRTGGGANSVELTDSTNINNPRRPKSLVGVGGQFASPGALKSHVELMEINVGNSGLKHLGDKQQQPSGLFEIISSSSASSASPRGGRASGGPGPPLLFWSETSNVTTMTNSSQHQQQHNGSATIRPDAGGRSLLLESSSVFPIVGCVFLLIFIATIANMLLNLVHCDQPVAPGRRLMHTAGGRLRRFSSGRTRGQRRRRDHRLHLSAEPTATTTTSATSASDSLTLGGHARGLTLKGVTAYHNNTGGSNELGAPNSYYSGGASDQSVTSKSRIVIIGKHGEPYGSSSSYFDIPAEPLLLGGGGGVSNHNRFYSHVSAGSNSGRGLVRVHHQHQPNKSAPSTPQSDDERAGKPSPNSLYLLSSAARFPLGPSFEGDAKHNADMVGLARRNYDNFISSIYSDENLASELTNARLNGMRNGSSAAAATSNGEQRDSKCEHVIEYQATSFKQQPKLEQNGSQLGPAENGSAARDRHSRTVPARQRIRFDKVNPIYNMDGMQQFSCDPDSSSSVAQAGTTVCRLSASSGHHQQLASFGQSAQSSSPSSGSSSSNSTPATGTTSVELNSSHKSDTQSVASCSICDQSRAAAAPSSSPSSHSSGLDKQKQRFHAQQQQLERVLSKSGSLVPQPFISTSTAAMPLQVMADELTGGALGDESHELDVADDDDDSSSPHDKTSYLFDENAMSASNLTGQIAAADGRQDAAGPSEQVGLGLAPPPPPPPPPPLSPGCDGGPIIVGHSKLAASVAKKPLVSLHAIGSASAMDSETIDMDDFKQRRDQLASKLHLPGMSKQQ